MNAYIEENFLGSYRIKLDPSYAMDRYIIEHGSWEIHIIQLINRFLRPASVGIDVGANAGYHVLAMAGAVGPNGHVYAFEPNELTFKKLQENIDLNPSLAKRITCERLALSNEPGELKVFQSGQELGNAYVSDAYDDKLWNKGGASDFSVCKAIRLDSYVPSEINVKLIKIDVEGMELEVLQGAEALLRNSHPIILFETLLENFSHDKIKAAEDYLRSLGYNLFKIDEVSGRLAPVTYPNFEADSIAIHHSDLVSAGLDCNGA